MVYFYYEPICGQFFFAISERKVLDQNGPYINIFNSKECLSVGNSGILSVVVVVYVLAPGYTSLCRGMKYSPKVIYTILVDPYGAEFLIFETVFLGRSATLPYV